MREKSNKYIAHQEHMDEDCLGGFVLQITTENLEESLQTGDSVLTGETHD
jgi:hypothetical protein